MESNDAAKAAMNEIGGILFSPINMAGTAILAGCNPPTHPNLPLLDPPPPPTLPEPPPQAPSRPPPFVPP